MSVNIGDLAPEPASTVSAPLPNGCVVTIDTTDDSIVARGGEALIRPAAVYGPDGKPLPALVLVRDSDGKQAPGEYVVRELRPGISTNTDLWLELEHMQRIERLSIEAGVEPGIPRAFAVIDAGGRQYLLMERASGKSLREWIAEGLSVPKAVGIVAKLLETKSILERPEAGRLVYNDFKPANVFFDNTTGSVRLFDFGYMRSAGTLHPDPEFVLGTSAWMAPERCHGGVPYDIRSDVWALGALLLEMLTGAYDEARQVQAPTQHLQMIATKKGEYMQAVESALSSFLETPKALEAIIRKAMSFDVKDRYQSADEMLEALRASGYAPVEAHRTPLDPGLRIEPQPSAISLVDERLLPAFLKEKKSKPFWQRLWKS